MAYIYIISKIIKCLIEKRGFFSEPGINFTLRRVILQFSLLKGGYNMLTKCKSFADAFIIQTCGNNKQLDYATPRSTNCACSAVFKQNRFNSA